MGPNVEDVIAGLDPAERRKVEELAAELIAEEMTLRDLRRARHLTRISVARELGVSQDAVSQMEQRSDLLLSTLRRAVKAMGGIRPATGETMAPPQSDASNWLRADAAPWRLVVNAEIAGLPSPRRSTPLTSVQPDVDVLHASVTRSLASSAVVTTPSSGDRCTRRRPCNRTCGTRVPCRPRETGSASSARRRGPPLLHPW